jgi:Putative transposase
MWQNKRVLFALLFEATAATLLEVAANPQRLGALIGFLSVLHTWGQTLQPHPHIHFVVPGGGLSPDQQRWIHSPPQFFLPVRVLSRVFRGKFVAGLKKLFRKDLLQFCGACQHLSDAKAFHYFLRRLFREDWVVYAKQPFGGPEHVLHYLARYTHRVAISNHRLLNVTDHDVTFRWKDYAHRSKLRAMTLTHEEFLRRFLQHVLPTGFPRIRYFGFLANRGRKLLLPLCRRLLDALPATVAISTSIQSIPVLVARHPCRSWSGLLPFNFSPSTADWSLFLTAHNRGSLLALGRAPQHASLHVSLYVRNGACESPLPPLSRRSYPPPAIILAVNNKTPGSSCHPPALFVPPRHSNHMKSLRSAKR